MTHRAWCLDKTILPLNSFQIMEMWTGLKACLMKCSGLVHWDDLEGWDGEGRGRRGSGWGTHVNPWLIHVNVWQKPLQYCEVISLQLIKINVKKEKKRPH